MRSTHIIMKDEFLCYFHLKKKIDFIFVKKAKSSCARVCLLSTNFQRSLRNTIYLKEDKKFETGTSGIYEYIENSCQPCTRATFRELRDRNPSTAHTHTHARKQFLPHSSDLVFRYGPAASHRIASRPVVRHSSRSRRTGRGHRRGAAQKKAIRIYATVNIGPYVTIIDFTSGPTGTSEKGWEL